MYFTTPFLVVAAWLANRGADSGSREPDDPAIPARLRELLGGVGVVIVIISLLLFLAPGVMVPLWPWKLSPLTARVMSAMFALPGIVLRGIARDERWSAARVSVEAQAFSIGWILIAAARARGDFRPIGLSGYLFLGGLGSMLLGIAWLYRVMEARRKVNLAT